MTPTPSSKSSKFLDGNIVLLGARGMLGSDLAFDFERRFPREKLFFPTHAECDLAREKEGLLYLASKCPSLIVNAAAFANVDKAETDREAAFQSNVTGPGWLVRFASDHGAKLIHFSTDQVFDGTTGQPYSETDTPNPLNYYAETKLKGEELVLKNSESLVLRVQWLYGRTRDRFTPIRYKSEYSVFKDQFGAPTWTEELCHWLAPLMQGNAKGIFHMVHDDYASWSEIFRFVIQTTGWSVTLKEMATAEANLPAKRPRFSVLSNAKLRAFLNRPQGLGGFREPLKRFVAGV